MIYLDTSVALAHLLGEDRVPPAALWEELLVSSRLLEYELWTRLHARGAGRPAAEAARALLGRVALAEVSPLVVERALEPFPAPVRTLDVLHLATAAYLRGQGQPVRLATYDDRMAAVGHRMGIPRFDC